MTLNKLASVYLSCLLSLSFFNWWTEMQLGLLVFPYAIVLTILILVLCYM